MLAGELYFADKDVDLIKERLHSKKLCYKFNNLPVGKVKARKKILNP